MIRHTSLAYLAAAAVAVSVGQSAWGQVPLRLNLPDTGISSEVRISPDGQYVVFGASGPLGYNLYSAPITGASPARALNVASESGSIYFFQIAPDSRHVAFQQVEYPNDLMSVSTFGVPIDGSSAAAKLQTSAVFDDDPSQFAFGISGDSSRVLFLADQDRDQQYTLYSRPFDGSSERVALSGSPENMRRSFLPAGGRVVFDQGGLFSRPVDGSGQTAPLFPSLSDISAVTPDGARVVFTGNENGIFSLYSGRVDGSEGPVKLHTPQPQEPFTAFFRTARMTPDGRRMLVVNHEFRDFRSVPVDGSDEAVLMTPQAGMFVDGRFELAPDSSRVVYLGEVEQQGRRDLFSQPVDGSAPPIKLNASIAAADSIWPSNISADGKWVAYTVNSEELFRVPADGSGPAIKVTLPVSHFTPIGYSAISPDGRMLGVSLDTDNDPLHYIDAVYVMPIEGGEWMRATHELPFGASWFDWQFSPDGNSIVYRAENESRTANDLFVVSIPEPGAIMVVVAMGAMGRGLRRRGR